MGAPYFSEASCELQDFQRKFKTPSEVLPELFFSPDCLQVNVDSALRDYLRPCCWMPFPTPSPWIHQKRTPTGWIGPRDADPTSPDIADARQMECESCGGRDFKKPNLWTSWKCRACGGLPGKDRIIGQCYRTIEISSPFRYLKHFGCLKTCGANTPWAQFSEDLLIQEDRGGRGFKATSPGPLCLAQPPSAKTYFVRQTEWC